MAQGDQQNIVGFHMDVSLYAFKAEIGAYSCACIDNACETQIQYLNEMCREDGAGHVILLAEESEDMWHIYNLIQVSDQIKTSTIRKVVKEGATGSTSSQRVRLNLQIQIEEFHFDPTQCALRIKGKNVMENPHVRLGAYHTLDLEMNQKFTLTKECWDLVSLERIEMACDISKTAELGAVVMQLGLAHLCLIKSHMTVIKARVEMNIAKKRTGSTAHGKCVIKFYESVMQAIKRHFDFSLLKCVILASPGFVKEDFHKYLMEQAVRQDDKLLLENKSKFLLCHSSSGHKHALDEVLNDAAVLSQVADTNAVEDVKCLDTFFKMLHEDQDRAYYGYKHIMKADEQLAIDTLMITDELFRSEEIKTRRRYIDLVESVREHGGNVRLFSSMHISGEKLGQLSGIAAILRYPLPELDDPEDDSEEEEKTSRPQE